MPLGAGYNTLVRDGGVEGVVIHLAKHVNAISHTDGSCAQKQDAVMLKLPDMPQRLGFLVWNLWSRSLALLAVVW